MSNRSRRNLVLVVLLLVAVLALLLVFGRCSRPARPLVSAPVQSVPPAAATAPVAPTVAAPRVDERLSAATLAIPEQVDAGMEFRAAWTGPDNAGDYLTIVRPDAASGTYENYRETHHGSPLTLVAPMESGAWEVRYVTVRSKTVLARAALVVRPVGATITAPEAAVLGTAVTVTWSGPNNPGDYVCIVPHGAPDAAVGNYAETARGSPLSVNAPVVPGPAEIRYVSGQGRKILGGRALVIVAPEMSLEAATEVVAGTKFSVTWRGPKNPGDYITVVPKGTPDGQYRNYTDTAKGSPLEITALIDAGPAELRYMTGTGARVLARRPIQIVAAAITLDAPAQAVTGATVIVQWTGPGNPGDYLTLVPKTSPDGQYASYADLTKGTPVKLTAPKSAGVAEVRYMSGQGAKVLARRELTIVGP
ncbi:ribosomal eL8 family protein [Horticoccus sp. 23ND18S-11]|uniref:hypothetical protein n=1 Tax=Horticoccus sp. 23ND18S-11 TaxID=3391832 RepID=UPI0039C9DE8A